MAHITRPCEPDTHVRIDQFWNCVTIVDENEMAGYRHLTEANAETLASTGLRRAGTLVGC